MERKIILEREVGIESPITGGPVKEVFALEKHDFRGEEYWVRAIFYSCLDTGENFTTLGQDPALDDLYAQYRIKHGLPFPEEIIAIRKRYGLTQQEITKMLGFGANQYGQYEKGQVPSLSNGLMIAALKDKSFALKLAKEAGEQIYKKVLSAPDEDVKVDPIEEVLYPVPHPTIYSGFTSPKWEKAKEMVRYLLAHLGPTTPTKLNKAMFYADFTAYRDNHASISGLTYNALTFGPCPANYTLLYENIPGVSYEDYWAHGVLGRKYSVSSNNDPTAAIDKNESKAIGSTHFNLNEKELQVLDKVIEAIKDLSTQEAVEASHQEPAWSQQPLNSPIPYHYASTLRLV